MRRGRAPQAPLALEPFLTALTHLQEFLWLTEGEVHSLRSCVGATWLPELRPSLPGWSLPAIEKSSESRKEKFIFCNGHRRNLVTLNYFVRET